MTITLEIHQGLGIRDIFVHRARAEVTRIDVAIRNDLPTGQENWTHDLRAEPPDDHVDHRYGPNNPALFQARAAPLQIGINAWWFWAGTTQDIVRHYSRESRDMTEVLLYTADGAGEHANTIIKFVYDRPDVRFLVL